MTHNNQVLVLGGPDSGKTTYLLQLYGRAAEADNRVRLRGAVESLAAIEEGLARLASGRPAGHTPNGTDTSLTLPLVDSESGREWDVTVPDYAGEDLRRIGTALRLTERWRGLASSSDHWIVMVRLSQHPDIPDLVNRPVGELARGGFEQVNRADATTLPIDMFLVELLQLLQYGRSQIGAASDLRVSVVISCWDELGQPDGKPPSDVVREQLALLDSYCASTFGSRYRVLGLSSQGRKLTEENPDAQFIDEGPEAMGWLIGEDGSPDSDLTKLIATV